jgi:hypothetical protein
MLCFWPTATKLAADFKRRKNSLCYIINAEQFRKQLYKKPFSQGAAIIHNTYRQQLSQEKVQSAPVLACFVVPDVECRLGPCPSGCCRRLGTAAGVPHRIPHCCTYHKTHVICLWLIIAMARKRILIFIHPGSRISDPGHKIENNFENLSPWTNIIVRFTQNIVTKLLNMGWGSEIRKKPIPDPGSQILRSKKHRIPDADPQHLRND